jgi:hypothetical protein
MFFHSNGNFKNGHQAKLLIIALVFFSSAIYLQTLTERPAIQVSKQDSALNVRSDFLIAFSFGNKRLISDLIWIKTLMESDEAHYRGEKFNNWLYLRFKTISDLDPLFYQNYLYGGQLVAIVKDDPEAANVLYEKGLSYYPDDFALNYHAGFNYYFEQENYQKGFEKFSRIRNHPRATQILKSVITKMELELTYDFDLALSLLEEQLANAQDDMIKNRLKADIYAVKAERDLKCLNEGNENCEFKDADGKPYLNVSGGFQAAKEFKLYRLKRKSDQKNREE